MAKLEKALRRDRKRNKKRYGMRVDGKSIFQIKQAQKDRDLEWKRRREEKEAMIEETSNE